MADDKVRILVVDDDVVCLRAIEMILKEYDDCDLEKVDSAEKALICVYEKGLELQPKWYDMILMDIKLPVLKGSVVTKIIRETEARLSDIPIIAITGSATEEDIKHYIELGMDEVLIKPVTKKMLDKVFKKYLDNPPKPL